MDNISRFKIICAGKECKETLCLLTLIEFGLYVRVNTITPCYIAMGNCIQLNLTLADTSGLQNLSSSLRCPFSEVIMQIYKCCGLTKVFAKYGCLLFGNGRY